MKLHALALIPGLILFSGAVLAQAKPAMPDPKLVECRKNLAETYKSIQDILKKGREAKTISADDEAEYLRIEASRKKDWEAKNKDGVSVQECEAHLKGMQGERARVAGMASAVDPQLSMCRKGLADTYKSIQDTLAKGRASKTISAVEEAEYLKIEAARKKDIGGKAADGLNLTECRAHRVGLEKEKARVTAMAAS
jgi:hypothetical protein